MDRIKNGNDAAELGQSEQVHGDLAADTWHEMFAAAAEASRVSALNSVEEQSPKQDFSNNSQPQLGLPRLGISDYSSNGQTLGSNPSDSTLMTGAVGLIGLHSLNDALRTQELSHETSILDQSVLRAKARPDEAERENREKLQAKSGKNDEYGEKRGISSLVATSISLSIGNFSDKQQFKFAQDIDKFQSGDLNSKASAGLSWIDSTRSNSGDQALSAKPSQSTSTGDRSSANEIQDDKSEKNTALAILRSANEVSQSEQMQVKGPNGKNFEIEQNSHGGKDELGVLESDRESGKNAQSKYTDSTGTVALQKANKLDGHQNEHREGSRKTELDSQSELRRNFRKGMEHFEQKFAGGAVVEFLLSPFNNSIFNKARDLPWKDRGWKPAENPVEKSKPVLPAPERLESNVQTASAEAAIDWTEKLKQEAIKKLPTEESKQRFLSCLEQFKQKAAMNKIPAMEVEETCKQLSKLLAATESAMPEADRVLATESFVQHLAFPSSCDQGHHNTCNVTTLAERNFRRRPSVLAEMLKITALSGKWIAPDGKEIKIASSSLVPGGEEQSFPRAYSSDRTFATQILNNVLANDISQRRVPAEFYTQEKPQSIDDSGERLKYADGSLVSKEPPAVHVEELDAAQNRLTGESKFVIFNTYFKAPNDALVGVGTEQELHRVLLDMKEQDKLPAVLYVDTRHKAFGGDDKFGDSKPRAHVVSITDYDESKQLVSISNQWGAAWNREYGMTELFRCTMPIEADL